MKTEARLEQRASELRDVEIRALVSYLRHPAHDELGARFGQSLSGALVYDVEVGGVEALRSGLV